MKLTARPLLALGVLLAWPSQLVSAAHLALAARADVPVISPSVLPSDYPLHLADVDSQHSLSRSRQRQHQQGRQGCLLRARHLCPSRQLRLLRTDYYTDIARARKQNWANASADVASTIPLNILRISVFNEPPADFGSALGNSTRLLYTAEERYVGESWTWVPDLQAGQR